MKKIIITILSVIVLFSAFGCSESSSEYLSSRNLRDFPFPESEKLIAEDKDNAKSTYNCGEEEYFEYVGQVYDYLKGKNYVYFGTQGEYISSLFGASPDYEFVPCDSVEQFCVENGEEEVKYTFICSNEMDQDSRRLNLNSSAGVAVYLIFIRGDGTLRVEFKTNLDGFVLRKLA